jgi:hypothetical protein
MAYCSNCGTELNEGTKFCPQCGKVVEQKSKEEKRKTRQVTKNNDNDFRWYHYLELFGLVLFFYLFFVQQCEGCSDSKEDNSEVVEKQDKEQVVNKPSNPYQKFVGKYVLYDDEGRTSFFHFKVNEKGHFLKSIGITSEYDKYGTIDPVSDDAFCISLYGNKRIYIDHDDEYWPWANGVRHQYLGPNKTIRFDIKEKRMYPDNEEYENREYKTPTYYKFRFTK